LVDRGAACRVPWSVLRGPWSVVRHGCCGFGGPVVSKRPGRGRLDGRRRLHRWCAVVAVGTATTATTATTTAHHHSIPPQPVPQSPVPRELLDPSDRSFVTYSWNFFIREITSGNEHKKYSIRASENSAAALQKNTFHRTNSQRDRPTESDALRPDHVLPSERLATAAG